MRTSFCFITSYVRCVLNTGLRLESKTKSNNRRETKCWAQGLNSLNRNIESEDWVKRFDKQTQHSDHWNTHTIGYKSWMCGQKTIWEKLEIKLREWQQIVVIVILNERQKLLLYESIRGILSTRLAKIRWMPSNHF